MASREKTKKENYDIKVKRATEFKSGDVAFDLTVNGVTIYGCVLREGRNGAFISFPSRKGSDGKYYNITYFPITENTQNEIEKQINELL